MNAAASPATLSPRSPAPGSLLAVKKPSNDADKSAVYTEARILSRLAAAQELENDGDDDSREKHVVRFFGYVPKDNALVMEAVSLRLDQHVRTITSTPTAQREPVIGTQHWLQLALDLVSGLNWLHQKGGIAHSDIKPENILLQPREQQHNESNAGDDKPATFPYRALYTDFGSSYDLLGDMPISTEASTASFGPTVGTPSFTAPELLSLQRPSEQRHPTPESDVFSLAVTLVVPVTGDTKIYHVSSLAGLYHMAQNGSMVLDNVRNVHAMRLPVGGVVTKLLKNAVHQKPERRISGMQWAEEFRSELAK